MKLLMIIATVLALAFVTVSASACPGSQNNARKRTTTTAVKVSKVDHSKCAKCSGKDPKAPCTCAKHKECSKCSGKDKNAKCTCDHGKKKS